MTAVPVVDPSMVEQRYDAESEVLDGAPVKATATRYGIDRRTLSTSHRSRNRPSGSGGYRASVEAPGLDPVELNLASQRREQRDTFADRITAVLLEDERTNRETAMATQWACCMNRSPTF